jgi:hypothetical protein
MDYHDDMIYVLMIFLIFFIGYALHIDWIKRISL